MDTSALASDHFEVREVAPGVHALIARRGGTAVGNSAVVDLGDRTLVVDTFSTLQAADDLLAVTLALTGRRAAIVVNSHWHDDHTFGNQLFAGAEIVATRRTVELIAASIPADRAALAEEIEEGLAFARRALAEAGTDEERARAEGWLRVFHAQRTDLPRFRLTLPDRMVEHQLTVAGAGRSAAVLSYGGGHTESDTFVHLPDDHVVIAGDLLFVGRHPWVASGAPGAWAGILERMAALGAAVIVPGHGPVGGPGDLAELAAYLRALAALVEEVVARGVDDDTLAALPVPAGSEGWEGRLSYAGGLQALVARRRAAGGLGSGP